MRKALDCSPLWNHACLPERVRTDANLYKNENKNTMRAAEHKVFEGKIEALDYSSPKNHDCQTRVVFSFMGKECMALQK